MQVNFLPSSLFCAIAMVTSLGCSSPTYTVRPAAAAVTSGPGARSMVVVRIAIPWYAPRFVVRGKFHDALPEYEKLAPLEAKYFTISDDDRYGGLYLWKTRADADLHFDAAWRAGIRRRRGVDADVLTLDAPYVIEGRAAPQGKPTGERAVEYPAWASFVQWQLPSGASEADDATAIANSPWTSDAMIRAMVVTSHGTVGVIALWATRAAAEKAGDEENRRALGRTVSAVSSSVALFEAPLLVDSKIREEVGKPNESAHATDAPR